MPPPSTHRREPNASAVYKDTDWAPSRLGRGIHDHGCSPGAGPSPTREPTIPGANKPDALAGLLVANKVDAIGLFVAGVPQVEAAEAKLAKDQNRAPRKVVTLPYSDYMTDMYGTVLITSAKLVEDDPDLVRRFTGALMKGLQYAVEHPQESGQILHDMDAKQNSATAARELELMKPFAVPPGGHPYGWMDASQVARSVAILQNLPMPHVAPEELVAFDLVPQ